ncbi:MAG: TRAP transporter large permease [Deltaproteobacteria bacterium]|nr:TRAP transporter large permease [Deltaproteobacteria bacterium]
MDPITIAAIGMGVMFLLIVLQVPIGISMAVVGITGFGILAGFTPAVTIIGTECVSALGNVDLAVIPLFLLMGNFATASGISGDIYNLAYAFLGHRRGGLALSTIGGCGFFGAICGSSPATAATFGRVALPEMLKRGYSTSFATGCIAAGGTLGSMVPPSVIMIIFAVQAEEFIFDLFIGAIIPAVLEVLLYAIVITIYVRVRPAAGPAGPRASWSERFKTLWGSWAALIIGIAVIGGIYFGIFTVTQAASVGAAMSFVFVFFRGKLTWKVFWETLIETANSTAMIYIIIIGANILTYFITLTRMPDFLVTVISGLPVPNILILFILLVVYLVLGSIFDTVAAMLITLPFVLPLITRMGYHPVWWGIVNVAIIETGMITPPIGLNVFILHGVTKVPLSTIYRGTMPFVISDFVRVAILVLFPSLVLWLPSLR